MVKWVSIQYILMFWIYIKIKMNIVKSDLYNIFHNLKEFTGTVSSKHNNTIRDDTFFNTSVSNWVIGVNRWNFSIFFLYCIKILLPLRNITSLDITQVLDTTLINSPFITVDKEPSHFPSSAHTTLGVM